MFVVYLRESNANRAARDGGPDYTSEVLHCLGSSLVLYSFSPY